jgi:hypothetical protein
VEAAVEQDMVDGVMMSRGRSGGAGVERGEDGCEGDIVARAVSVVPCKGSEEVAIVREEGVLTKDLKSRGEEVAVLMREESLDVRGRLFRGCSGAGTPGHISEGHVSQEVPLP